MAEIALAIPGLVDVIARCGFRIMNILSGYSGHDEILVEYQKFAEDISKGGMSFFHVETLRRAYQDRTLPEAIKELLERRLFQFNTKLSGTVNKLSDAITWENGRISYALRDRQILEQDMQDLKAQRDLLHQFGQEICMFSISLHSSFLTADNFVLIHETRQRHPGEYLPNSDIILAQGNINLGLGKSRGQFIVEGKVDGEKHLRALCQTLRDANVAGGIPECVGYRRPPYGSRFSCYELIFKAASEESLMSLAHAICSRPAPGFRVRLQLCQTLARAVRDTHRLNLVHKNIRPRSILLVGPLSESSIELPKIYLMKWTWARHFNSVSAHLGEHLWQQALYQHPNRQSERAMSGFESYHDLYSLGVCMLEILLWKPFTIGSPPPKLSLYGSLGLDEEINQYITSPAWMTCSNKG